MKAIRIHQFGGSEVLQLETDVPIPKPKENEVLIKVKAAGVNPVDTIIRSGNFGPLTFPAILGMDAAGIVSEVGSHVTDVKVGDRVFCVYASGAYAEYTTADASHVWKLPDTISFSQGAALGVPYFTALRCLKHRANAKAGETLLVHGASGAVGLAACQLGKAMKLNVVGTASTDEGANLVRESGATLVLNHKDPNHRQKLQDATKGKGFDVILEMLASSNLQVDLEVVANHGRIVVIGSHGKIEIEPLLLMTKEATCTGVILGNTSAEEWHRMGELISNGLAEGWLVPVVDQTFSLAQAAQAQQAVVNHEKGSRGKIVLTTC